VESVQRLPEREANYHRIDISFCFT